MFSQDLLDPFHHLLKTKHPERTYFSRFFTPYGSYKKSFLAKNFKNRCFDLENNISIKRTLQKGRGIYAKRRFSPAEIVFTDSPLISLPKKVNISKFNYLSRKRIIAIIVSKLLHHPLFVYLHQI